MLKRTLAFLFLCSATLLLFSQQSKGIKGKVLDREGKTVEGVTVTFVDKSNAQNRYEIKTDKDGVYLYAGLPYSSEGYTVSVKVGDMPEVSKIIKVKTLEMVELNFDMKTDLVVQETKQEVANPAADAQDLFKMEDYEGALLKTDEAIKAEDKANEKAVLLIRAACFEKLNKIDDELQTYLKYEELYPKSDKEKEVIGRLADIYSKKDDKANAEKYKKLYKDLGGQVLFESYNKGVELLNDGNSKEAAEYFRKAITEDASNADAHKLLSRCLVSIQPADYKGAVEHLKIYLKMKPDAEDAAAMKQALAYFETQVK